MKRSTRDANPPTAVIYTIRFALGENRLRMAALTLPETLWPKVRPPSNPTSALSIRSEDRPIQLTTIERLSRQAYGTSSSAGHVDPALMLVAGVCRYSQCGSAFLPTAIGIRTQWSSHSLTRQSSPKPRRTADPISHHWDDRAARSSHASSAPPTRRAHPDAAQA